MLKAFVPLLLSALILPVSASAAEQQYSVTAFDTVRMQGPFTVVITTGKGNSARGEGDRAALDRVSMSVSGGVLTIRALPSRTGEGAGSPGRITLHLTTAVVRRVMMGGSGTLRIDGMKAVRGDLNLAGSGELVVDGIAVDQLVVNSAGNGRLRLNGSAGSIKAQVIGAGSIEATELVTKAALIDSQGPGTIAMNVTGTAEVSVKGAGDVTVLGKAACKVTQAGSGNVVCGE